MSKKKTISEVRTTAYEWAVSARSLHEAAPVYEVSLAAKPQPARTYGACIGLRAADSTQIIRRLKSGLPIRCFDALQKELDVSAARLAGVIRVAVRTLARRKKEGRFETDESERLFRIARLYDRACEVLGGPDRARLWLKSPKQALGGQMPLDYADTEEGAREVSNLLGRLEHGVFS